MEVGRGEREVGPFDLVRLSSTSLTTSRLVRQAHHIAPQVAQGKSRKREVGRRNESRK